ncbi:MAG: hypothetical protein RMY64_25370 [Nostoc sp. DedQUE08]|uniref:hypothetical protein n=1 Tax=unclassified Nostoc TaxID=2593658 RepID=UPI002AD2FF3A|nr:MULTISPECIES: hypothetical protein [unclassified Nostoc]MDZ8068924.1 hypothetical protein [Nostoc sp. DedQUE08]MDZ8095688.1 hypothetical protein [Nostoc sp. DedQUE05]
MQPTTNQKLFTEITAEEAANINGGNFFQPMTNWINDRINETNKAVQTVVNYYRFRPWR